MHSAPPQPRALESFPKYIDGRQPESFQRVASMPAAPPFGLQNNYCCTNTGTRINSALYFSTPTYLDSISCCAIYVINKAEGRKLMVLN